MKVSVIVFDSKNILNSLYKGEFNTPYMLKYIFL